MLCAEPQRLSRAHAGPGSELLPAHRRATGRVHRPPAAAARALESQRRLLPIAIAGVPMFDYIFFHPLPAREFADWLREQGVTTGSREDDEGYIVEVPEDLDDALDAAVDARYHALLERNEELLNAEQGAAAGYHGAGICVHLHDGRVSYADIDPKLLGRVMGCVTPEEFATLVDAIVTAVENPQQQTYCQRQRDEGEGS